MTFDVPEIKQSRRLRVAIERLDRDRPRPASTRSIITSDDGSRLYIGGQERDQQRRPARHAGEERAASNFPPARIRSWSPISTTAAATGWQLAWTGPGIKKQASRADRTTCSTGGEETLHDVAIRSLASIPGHERKSSATWPRWSRPAALAPAAIRVLRTIPANSIGPSRKSARWSTAWSAISARCRPTIARRRGARRDRADQVAGRRAAREQAQGRRSASGEPRRPRDRHRHRARADDLRQGEDRVEAGKPVELRFSNADKMPHNFALVQPGAMEEVGLLAEATAQDARRDGTGSTCPSRTRSCSPASLLQPGDSQALSFEAPKAPGMYPYVCTYPGHWRRMYGALYVVENLEEYEADPAGYLASHGCRSRTNCSSLIGHEPRVEARGAGRVRQAARSPAARSKSARTRSRFPVAWPATRSATKVKQIGPDLTKLDPKKRCPSDSAFAADAVGKDRRKVPARTLFVLDSGKIVTGLVLEETPEAVTVIENPLAKTKPLVIAKKSISTSGTKSPKSIMPEGLLSKLTREEILDLIAFIHAGGDKKNPLFHMHMHGHGH